MTPLTFIDAHHHLWLREGGYPWLASTDPALQRDYTASDYLTDLDGHVPLATVHVEAAHDPRTPVDETEWLDSNAAERIPAAIVARAELQDPGLEAVLARHLEASPKVRGVRQMLDWNGARQGPTTLMDDSRWRAGLNVLAAHSLTFDLQVVPGQLERAAHLAADHPGVSFVLNHAGYNVPAGRENTIAWRAGIAAIALVPNVAVKLSGFPALRGAAGAPDADEFFGGVVEQFGWDRVMFASNFPHDRRFISFTELLEVVDAALPAGVPTQRADFFHATAARVYRIDTSRKGPYV